MYHVPQPLRVCELLRTGFAAESGYEQTFSKLPRVTRFNQKLSKQKDFCSLIIGSFNQNRLSLRSNVLGGFWDNRRRMAPGLQKWRRKKNSESLSRGTQLIRGSFMRLIRDTFM